MATMALKLMANFVLISNITLRVVPNADKTAAVQQISPIPSTAVMNTAQQVGNEFL